MPSKKQYDLVQNDDYDTRIPLHTDEAFNHGITFQAKFIGSLDVPRPSSRVEIVAAMRRIRYEFKSKGIKKKKVTIDISIDGVKVILRKKKKKKHWLDEGKPILLSHPIYRIFYVSHDSQDMKIFSYIARDGASNVFKCAVFKSNKKNQAMKIVRTIGQAFEVCHKLEITAPEADINENYDQEESSTQDLLSDRLSDLTSEKCRKDIQSDADLEKLSLTGCDDNYYKENELKSSKYNYMKPHIDILAPPPNCNNKTSSLISAETYSSPHSDILTTESGCLSTNLPPPGSSLSAHHEIQLLKEQLEQQNQQTQAAFAQLQLTREQLAAEQAARMEAQSRTHQLLIHNRELLDHIAALVSHLQNTNENSSGNQPHLTLPQYQQQQQEYSDIDYQQNYGFIENRGVTTNSPIKFNPTGTIFNFPSAYPQIHETYDPRLNYYQPSYFNKFNYYPNYYPTSPPTATTNYRHNSEPRQFPYFLKKAPPTTTPATVTNTNFNEQQKCVLKQQQQQQQQNEQRIDEQITKKSNLIKPLPHVGTVTNKDSEGNLRLFVPIKTSTTSTLTNNSNDNDHFLSNLRITDNFQNTQPIQRSTSEKLPISQTPRTIWTRHTTNN